MAKFGNMNSRPYLKMKKKLKFMISGFAVDLLQCFIVYTQFHIFLYPFWLIPRIGYHY